MRKIAALLVFLAHAAHGSDGRIAAIGRRGDVRLPHGAEVINATGRFLLPGFWNSHVHLLEVNRRLHLDRGAVYGLRPALEAGAGMSEPADTAAASGEDEAMAEDVLRWLSRVPT